MTPLHLNIDARTHQQSHFEVEQQCAQAVCLFIRCIFKVSNSYKETTVKPVYNGHNWDSTKVAVVQRWSLFGGFYKKYYFKDNNSGSCSMRSMIML